MCVIAVAPRSKAAWAVAASASVWPMRTFTARAVSHSTSSRAPGSAGAGVVLGRGREEVHAGEAVDLQVDEAGHGEPGGAGRGDAHGRHAAVLDLHVPGDLGAVDERGANTELHGAGASASTAHSAAPTAPAAGPSAPATILIRSTGATQARSATTARSGSSSSSPPPAPPPP